MELQTGKQLKDTLSSVVYVVYATNKTYWTSIQLIETMKKNAVVCTPTPCSTQ